MAKADLQVHVQFVYPEPEEIVRLLDEAGKIDALVDAVRDWLDLDAEGNPIPQPANARLLALANAALAEENSELRKRPRAQAYAVATVDTRSGVVEGASIFSEPHPTLIGSRRRQFVVETFHGESFSDALPSAEAWLRSGEAAWLGALVDRASDRLHRRREVARG